MIRHFLFKAVEEVNDDLIKDNKPYRVDFGYDIGAFFLNETKSYWEKYDFYNDDGTISYLKLDKNMQVLDLLISEYTNDKELTLFPKELKTDLVVLFL